MKRIIYFLLLFVFILSVSSCGITEEEYTYNYLPVTYPRLVSFGMFRSRPITSGALVSIDINDMNGKIRDERLQYLNCLFNEETKVLVPLCFSVTCSHDTNECFANEVYKHDYLYNRGVYKDKIFNVEIYKDSSSGKVTYCLAVNYYSLDGTLIDTVKYDPELIKSDGTKAEYFYISSTHLQYGHKRYYRAYSSPGDNVPYDERYDDNWVICHDLETNTFLSYPLPRSKEGLGFSLVDVNETGLGCKNEEGIGYVLNFETGEITEYDCGEILDRLVSEGQLIRGFEVIDINPLKDYFVITMGRGRGYIRISTETGFIPTDVENYCVIDNPWRFGYDGDMYFLGKEYVDRSEYISLLTGEKFILADKERYYIIYSETEKGLILEYVNILPDGTREPTYEIRIEGGREVQYTFPKKLAYVTKEDFLDGSVDEPWFYDPETYSFVKQ